MNAAAALRRGACGELVARSASREFEAELRPAAAARVHRPSWSAAGRRPAACSPPVGRRTIDALAAELAEASSRPILAAGPARKT